MARQPLALFASLGLMAWGTSKDAGEGQMADQEMGPNHFPVMLAYGFGAEKGMKAEVDEIRHMEIEWDRSQTTSVKRGYLIDLFEKRGILDEFKTRYWPYGKTPRAFLD
jgi:hypothetical protein